jgi:tetratricopeptide (TPR) repeat protein
MTNTLPRDLTHCYSLLFTGDAEQKSGNLLKALMCFEECRILAESSLESNEVFRYSLFRAARKEAQMLILLGGYKRALRMLKKLMAKNYTGGALHDKMFIYAQMAYLSAENKNLELKYIKKIDACIKEIKA